jgi:hypothetical protein
LLREFLIQKSLKTKLQLKRYKFFKFQWLECKIVGARFEFISKLGARLEFVKSSGAFV